MLYNIMLVDDEAEVRQDYPGKEIVIFPVSASLNMQNRPFVSE